MERKRIIISTCEHLGIALVYILGSRVTEGIKILNNQNVEVKDRLTDIDIGIVFKEEVPIEKRYQIFSEIYNALSDLFLPLRLDITFLQENHSVLQSQALLGNCIYSADNRFKDEYEHNILARAADFKFVLNKYYEEKMEELN